ncbi:hypothetical protein DPMN_084020 [Dreissena polymorpha]|uniref:Uncharacterized protein n=1 Tax=Dreissena polymorpha TaxID=45954 RepID=A0A9D4BJ04_DREPO|nr:hypothetical protein DPMN_084020 [Dreissena polymorpha]
MFDQQQSLHRLGKSRRDRDCVGFPGHPCYRRHPFRASDSPRYEIPGTLRYREWCEVGGFLQLVCAIEQNNNNP